MSYLSLIIALFMANDNNGSAWWDKYLDNLVAVETWFYHASWWIWGILVVLLVVGLLWALKEFGKEGLLSCGCFVAASGIIILLLPLWEWVTLNLAKSMAAAVTPEGVLNTGKLVMSAVLYLLMGAG